jgi:hypothetical protein
MKLISTTEFILEQDELIRKNRITPYQFTMNVTDYALFLQRPLTLDMFVPCDDNENVLEEPIIGQFGNEQYEGAEWDVFSRAQEKVLFKTENIEIGKRGVFFDFKGIEYPWKFNFYNNQLRWDIRYYKIIEGLVSFQDIGLTDSAIKQLGL